jgi:hypothetical protein
MMMAGKEARTVVETAYFEGTTDVQAILYSDGTILVNGVRASYPHFGKAYESVGDDGQKKSKFSMKGMMPKATHKPAMRLMKKHMESMMQDNKTADLASDRKYLRNGDDLGKEEMKGHFVFSASEDTRPHLRDRTAKKVEPEKADSMFYGGCWVNALIRPWWQNHPKYGKRVNAGLSAVQFCRDDEPFGEGRISDEDVDDTFAPVGDTDSGFDDDDLDDL